MGRLADAADFGSLGGSGALLERSLGVLVRFRAVLVCYDGILCAQGGQPGSILGRWTGPGAPETSILGGPEPRFSCRFSIVLPFDFVFDFSMNFRCSLQPMPCRSWIGETSPNPDFVRPVEVFQGFFDIAHHCRHDESVVERSTIIQKSFEKIN